MSMFENASRKKYRFATPLGHLAVDDLWDAPLKEERAGLSLDNIARGLAKRLREEEEESFVEPKNTALSEELREKLEIVKHVISVRLAEAEERNKERERRERKQKLLEVLYEKRNEGLKALTIEEIEAQIDAL